MPLDSHVKLQSSHLCVQVSGKYHYLRLSYFTLFMQILLLNKRDWANQLGSGQQIFYKLSSVHYTTYYTYKVTSAVPYEK